MADQKTIRRAAWYSAQGPYFAVAGGSTFYEAGFTTVGGEYNWDEPEGWMPRPSFGAGTGNSITPTDLCFTNGNTSVGGNGNCWYNYDSSGLPSISRTHAGNSISTGTAGIKIELNNNGSSGANVYTLCYGANNSLATAFNQLSKTPPNGTWVVNWWGKKSATNETITQQMYILGCKQEGSPNYYYNHNFAGSTSVNATTSTIASPATGGSRYYANNELPGTNGAGGGKLPVWVNYSMCFTLNNDSNISALFIRLKMTKTGAAAATCWFDGLSMYPLNINQSDVADNPASTSNSSLNDSLFGTYH